MISVTVIIQRGKQTPHTTANLPQPCATMSVPVPPMGPCLELNVQVGFFSAPGLKFSLPLSLCSWEADTDLLQAMTQC